MKLKLVRIGNAHIVRLPAALLRRNRTADAIVPEERGECLVLRPAGESTSQRPWETAARELARILENWGEWDSTATDGGDADRES